MRRLLLLLPAAALLVACSSPPPYSTTVGILKPGATLEVRVAQATLNAYQPETGQRRDLFTIAATAFPKATPAAPTLRVARHGVVVSAPSPLQSLLVRVPDGANLAVQSRQGDVNVTDIRGDATVVAGQGNVTMMLPRYGQAAVGQGNLSVTIGSTRWPGTLRFSTRRGDVVLRVRADAAFDVHLHTGAGTLFTDFALRGTSRGQSETIDGSVNGGDARRIDVETTAGSIRLLRLQPQP